MFLEIVTPEQVILSSEVTSVTVPGVNGAFQILDHHAPIVSLLREGNVKIEGNATLNKEAEARFTKDQNNHLVLPIKGGVIEMKGNKAIVLAD